MVFAAYVWTTFSWRCRMLRVRHRYRNTCGDRVTGTMGMGMVLVFGTPQHTVYLYHSIMGIHGYIKIE